jgi:hypothetical protein
MDILGVMLSMLNEISGFGSPFSHDVTSCHNIPPTNFKWVFNEPSKYDIEVYMDYNIFGGIKSKSKNKFLWICESKGIIPEQINILKLNANKFQEIYKKIFVHDYSLLDLGPNFVYCPPAANSTWVVDRGIHKKSKMISMVSSGKAMCEGHVYRNNKMKEFKNSQYEIDYYGRSFNPFAKKEDVLKDYCFSITIENEKYSNYYTEKLMDCFACGTIPIYHGTPELKNMFNMEGVIILDDSFDINTLSKDFYYSKIEAIKDNFERCVNHTSSDDYIYNKILETL